MLASIRSAVLLASALLGALPAPARASAQEAAARAVDYTFQEAPVHSRGVRSLADLRGKPVLIGFWGMGEPKSVEGTVPAFLALQKKHGEDLQVVFVECQGTDPKAAEAFAWRHTWMRTAAMWTSEVPLKVEGDALPRFALLGCRGELLLSGDPLAQAKPIEKLVAEQIKRSQDPPAGTSKDLAHVWKAFCKGELGAAIALCDALAAVDPSAASLRAEIVARTHSRIACFQWLVDNGHVDEALPQLTELVNQVAGCPDFDDPIAELLARVLMRDDSLAAEAEVAAALAAVESKMAKGDPFKRAHVEELERIRQLHPSTRGAQRAAHLLELARIEP